MGTIADKLAYTAQAREEIREAIVGKGVDCPGTAPFCQFDDYIGQISAGTSASTIETFTRRASEDFYESILTTDIKEADA